MQYAEESVQGLCSNSYCTKGKDGKRQVVAIRDTRKKSYCSQACRQMMERYKNRYRGTNSGPLSRETINDKMTNL
ncbi:MAG: hypothetical protein AABY22_18440 [Nanoarchaeota archaeon]